MNPEEIFYIQSELLQLVEPLLIKYYDYDSSMLIDEMKSTIESNGVSYTRIENGIVIGNCQEAFYKNKSLLIVNDKYPFKDIADEYPEYFDFEAETGENRIDNGKVYYCLSYIGYIYYKEKAGLFNQSILFDFLDIEYQSVLHKKIYPEMLSLYKLILESKNNKKRGTPISLIYKQDKIDIHANQ